MDIGALPGPREKAHDIRTAAGRVAAQDDRDAYLTPPWATRALISEEKDRLPSNIWEPTASQFWMARPLISADYRVFTSDIQPCEMTEAKIDFLKPLTPDLVPSWVAAIVMNPPYSHGDDFVRRALERCDYVAAIVRLNFPLGKKRADIPTPSRQYAFRQRVNFALTYAVEKTTSNGGDSVWCVWDKKHRGPCEYSIIDPEDRTVRPEPPAFF